MSFPPSLTTRTVKGRFVTYPDGAPAKGSVKIGLDSFMQGPTDDAFVAPFIVEKEFDVNGEVSFVLPSNNDPQWTPANYRVVITVDEKVHREKLLVPYNGTGPIDLADVLNIPAPVPGQAYVLLSTKGVAGGVASLGSDGKIPQSQLPASSGGSVTWDSIEDKPDEFPPSGHTHELTVSWGSIQDKPATFPHDEVTFDQVSNKPASYPPSSHTHVISDITGLGAQVIVLGPSDPIPGGTPPGTVIVRTVS